MECVLTLNLRPVNRENNIGVDDVGEVKVEKLIRAGRWLQTGSMTLARHLS